MNTPSIRLSDNLHRAVKNSEYSIGELARDGIEQSLISDFDGVCWICGSAIHRRERRSEISRYDYEKQIAVESDVDWDQSDPSRERPDSIRKLREIVSQTEGDYSTETYYQTIGILLAVPEDRVEVCSKCTDLLEGVRNQRVQPSDIPLPYLFRDEEGDLEANYHSQRRDPVVDYAADSAAVYQANYMDFQRREGNEVFWWAAKNRHEKCKDGIDIWRNIALQSHAHRIGWCQSPRPVFEMSLEAAKVAENERDVSTIDRQPTGLLMADVERYLSNDICLACGTELDVSGYDAEVSEYCSTCFYTNKPCPDKGCSGTLQPILTNDDFGRDSIYFKCVDDQCDEGETPPEDYLDSFVTAYEPVLQDLRRFLPIEV